MRSGPAGGRAVSPLDVGRFTVGTFTALPVAAGRADRAVAGHAMLAAPAVGALLGAVAGALALGADRLGMSPLLCAVLAVCLLAALTRGLHLDGLADLADGLASRQPPAGALAVMRRPDIGPYGVVALLLVLLVQVAALATQVVRNDALAALVIASTAGRAAVPVACRRGVPAARADGLGAHVAGTVGPGAAGAVVAAAVVVCAVAAWVDDVTWWRGALAAAATVGIAWLLERHVVRRLGGITGDVLGALVEVGVATALVVLAATVGG